MLKDRRFLIEHDLALVKEEASKLYLQIVIGSSDDLLLSRYEQVRSKIANLQLDLAVINDLIERGEE